MARGKKTPGEKIELVKSLKYLNPEMSSKDIAKEVGIPDRTVRDILKEVMEDDEAFTEYRQQKKREQIVKALDIASKYIEHLAEPAVIASAKAKDAAIVAGTMIDKAQLLAGEPTQITERKEPTPELVQELQEKVIELQKLTGT